MNRWMTYEKQRGNDTKGALASVTPTSKLIPRYQNLGEETMAIKYVMLRDVNLQTEEAE